MSAANRLLSVFGEPLKVGSLQLKNRVIFAPCTRNRATIPGALQAEYYGQRASAGLIVSEGTLPMPQGYEYQNAPGIYSKKQIAGWRLVTDAVHAAGGVIFCQVMNIGRVANPLFQCGEPPMAPSAIAAAGGKFKQQPYFWTNSSGVSIEVGTDHVVPDAIDDPQAVIDNYRAAFENAKLAGFDGVQLHGGNGYLLSTFLHSNSNTRTDKYGGSPEKRCQFVLEVMDQAIEVFGPKGTAIKITPEGGYNDQGMPLPETLATFGHLLRESSKRQIAFVELQRWFSLFDPTHRGTIIPCTTWRKLFDGVLFLGGNISPQEGAELIRDGHCDGILFGRSFLSNPDLPSRLIAGQPLTPFDFTTGFSGGAKGCENGYTTYKRYDELTQTEKDEIAQSYTGYLAYLEQDNATTAKLLAAQATMPGKN